MGASQSTKRKKERRKRKRLSATFPEMPRSISVDAIRTMSVSPPLSSSYPQCQYSLSWSESIGVERNHPSAILHPHHHYHQHQSHCHHRHHQCRSNYDHNHSCLHQQYEDMKGGDQTANPSCVTDCHSCLSQSALPVSFSSRSQSMSEQDRPCYVKKMFSRDCSSERNSHPLNFECVSRLTSSTKSQNEVFGLMPQPGAVGCPQAALSLPTINSKLLVSEVTISRNSLQLRPHQLSSPPVSTTLSSPSQQWLTSSHFDQQIGLGNSNNRRINSLDDEAIRQSSWMKRKQMAQQLRDLRKHIREQESEEMPSRASILPSEHDENCDPTTEHSISSSSSSFKQINNQSKYSSSSTLQPQDSVDAMTPTSRRQARSKFSRMSNYRYLDNHPVLTRLQNEQNNRLETMEKRMKEIRISAMQEAERRKFAEIFPAKTDESETQRMLQEAKNSLERLKAEKRRKLQTSKGHQIYNGQENNPSTRFESDGVTSQGEDDSGDIIPVCVIPQRSSHIEPSLTKLREVVVNHENHGKSTDVNTKREKSFWSMGKWPKVDLNQPLTWFLLPFLLFLLILRLILSLVIKNTSASSTSSLTERSTSTNFSRNNDANSSRRLSDGHSTISRWLRLGSKKKNS